jgi:hypothetical protein
MNLYFVLALAASVLGPLLYCLIAPFERTARFVDAMVITAIVCLISLHILPESMQHSGITTLAAVTLGLFGPVLLSRISKRSQCEIQRPLIIISVLGFIAHNMLDGAALVIHPDEHRSTHLLALAIVIHRVIVSMALWKTLSKNFGLVLSICALTGLSFAMAMGYYFSEQLFVTMDANIFHILQSLSCGMLFHVLLHPHHIKEIFVKWKTPAFFMHIQSAGAICGLLLAVLAYVFWPAHIH